MTEVTLTWHEAAMAVEVAKLRRLASLKNGRTPSANGRKDGWTEDMEGACAELAVAKHFRIYWGGSVDTFKSEPDVGHLEVRATSHPSGRLIIRHDDADDAKFVLAVGVCPTYRLVGWLFGREGKQDRWLTDPTGSGRARAFFVPQDDLRPLGLLR